jgi:hypothetical protein
VRGSNLLKPFHIFRVINTDIRENFDGVREALIAFVSAKPG